jgi:hypothetical protein
MPLADYLTAPRRTAGFRQGLGPVRTPGGELRQWAHQVVEKVRVASVGGRLRFLPWYDPYTDETPEIRATYRIMLVDDAVKSAFLMKVLSVISQGVQFQPADDDNPRDRAVAQFCTYAFGKAKGGTPGLGWSIVAHGLIDGHSVCEPVWDDDTIPYGVWRGKRIFRAVKAKDTRYLQLGIDPYRNVTAIRGTGFNAGRVWSPSDFSIFSHLPLFENPAGMSDFRAAYQPFWIKRTVWQLRSLHLENYTGPYLVGHYPKEDIAQKTALQDAFEEAKASTWLTIPVGAMIETIDLSMRGTADFKDAIDDCNKAILVAIAGAHLQIMEGQVPGGRGNTKVQQGTAELAQWWLSESLATVYREQLVPLLVAENFHAVDTPQVSLGAVTEEAMLEMLKVDEGLQRLGALLAKADVYKRYGRQQPVEADDILQPPGAGGGGSPGPGGPEGGDGGSSAFAEGEYHGPEPPGPGWVQVGTGPHGGKVWRHQAAGGGEAASPLTKPAKRAKSRYVFPDKKPRRSNLYPPDDQLPELTATAAGLSPAETKAVKDYSSGYYLALNQALRSGAALSPKSREVYDGLKAALDRAPALSEPVTAWRGINLPADQSRQLFANMEAARTSGEPVEMRGMISTSLSPGGAVDFGSVMLEIRVGKGLYINPISTAKGERELILDHGTKFRVLGIKDIPFGSGGTRRMVQLEQVVAARQHAERFFEDDGDASRGEGGNEVSLPADPRNRFAADSLEEFVFPGAGDSLRSHSEDDVAAFCQEGENKGKPGPCPEEIEGHHAAADAHHKEARAHHKEAAKHARAAAATTERKTGNPQRDVPQWASKPLNEVQQLAGGGAKKPSPENLRQAVARADELLPQLERLAGDNPAAARAAKAVRASRDAAQRALGSYAAAGQLRRAARLAQAGREAPHEAAVDAHAATLTAGDDWTTILEGDLSGPDVNALGRALDDVQDAHAHDELPALRDAALRARKAGAAVAAAHAGQAEHAPSVAAARRLALAASRLVPALDELAAARAGRS